MSFRIVVVNLFVATLMTAGLAARLCAQTYVELSGQAAALAERGDYAAAINKYREALRLKPDAPEIVNNLAVVLYQAHQYSEALERTAPLWKAQPQMTSAALIAGLSAVQCRRYRDAISPLQHVLSIDPKNRDAILGLASAYGAVGQLSDAEQMYLRRTGIANADADAWYGLAICYEREAEAASEKLSRMPGGLPYFKQLLGEYLLAAGGQQLAREAFGDSRVNESTDTPQAREQFQAAHELANKSRDAFQTFVNLAPNSWQANVFYGDADRQRGNLNGAIAYYKKAAEQQPESAAAFLGMGTAYWQLGEFDSAQKYLREALRLNPNANQATFALGNIAVRQHREADAIPLLKTYLAVQPRALAAHADLGRCYFRMGNYSPAAEELSKAADADTTGEIHYQLAAALRKLGREEEAANAMKQSTEIRRAALDRERRLRSQQ